VIDPPGQPASCSRVNCGRPEPGAPRPAALVGEVHACDDLPGVAGACDEWFEVREHEFGPAEHREGAVLGDIAPGEIDKTGTRPALHRRAAEVQTACAGDNLDRDPPRRRLRVRAHQLARLFAHLNADVHVVVVRVV
jgi:hypothetical protein